MFHQKIKQCFSYSVHLVSSAISEFTYSDTDQTRNRKLPADKLITFRVSQGFSSTKMNSWTSSTRIHNCQLLRHSTSNAQSLALIPSSSRFIRKMNLVLFVKWSTATIYWLIQKMFLSVIGVMILTTTWHMWRKRPVFLFRAKDIHFKELANRFPNHRTA